MSGVERLGWNGGELVPTRADAPGRLRAADSWLVVDGRAVGLTRHERRFSGAARGGGDLMAFLAAVRMAVPTAGHWFPRIEARADGLLLILRPAPPLRSETVLQIPEHPDPRRVPTVKGPDLGILGELRARAQQAGADDALLSTPSGLVLETANSALAWWEDDILVLPPAELGLLPSVTVAQTEELGIPVRRRRVTVDEVLRRPVWVGSSLHGWTPVTGWVDPMGGRLEAAAGRAPLTAAEVNTGLWRRAESLR